MDYLRLLPHPDHPPLAVASVRAAAWRDRERWRFRYLVDGASKVILPDKGPTGRADGLWKTTCFEAFVGTAGDAYREYNFAPSDQWAAYDFDAPREGMREADEAVEVWLESGEDRIAVEASVGGSFNSGSPLGLSAVIEETGGQKSFWALAHGDGPPDFHDRDCFTATLPPVEAV